MKDVKINSIPIIKFMGIEPFITKSGKCFYGQHVGNSKEELYKQLNNSSKYHKDFNLLKEVWYKIENNNDAIICRSKKFKKGWYILVNTPKGFVIQFRRNKHDNLFINLYKVIVDYCKWYNERENKL